jgi:uncharacterized protein
MPTRVRRPAIIGVLIAATMLALASGTASGQTVSVGTNPPGSVFYSIGSGLAKVVSDAGPVRMSVQPYSGSSTFIPLLNSGELEFGVNNAVDMALAYRGPKFQIGGRNPFPFAPNARLVMRGSPFLVGLLVRKDSPIKTIHDIKGRRMTGEYPAHLAVWYNMFGHLASAGLTWKDVKVVPVPAVNDGVDALIQGRAEVTEFGINAAKVKEADAAVGVRHISTDCSPEGERRLRQAVPGYYPRWVRAGMATAVVEVVLKALWDNVEKLPPLHPVFKEWTREQAASADVTLPYHPAAVRFYKERGVWKPEMDQAQQKLLSLNP